MLFFSLSRAHFQLESVLQANNKEFLKIDV